MSKEAFEFLVQKGHSLPQKPEILIPEGAIFATDRDILPEEQKIWLRVPAFS